MTENRTNRIKRLIYRSSYTGMRETDRVLGGFAREFLPQMDDAGLDSWEDLLSHGDPNIWAWVSGQAPIPDDVENPCLAALIDWVRESRLS